MRTSVDLALVKTFKPASMLFRIDVLLFEDGTGEQRCGLCGLALAIKFNCVAVLILLVNFLAFGLLGGLLSCSLDFLGEKNVVGANELSRLCCVLGA